MLAETFVSWSGLPAEALERMADWTFVQYPSDGEPAAIAALKGTEIHFVCAQEQRHRLLFRERIREFLAPLFEERGFLTTRIVRDEDALNNARFVTRLGFELTQSDADHDYYMLAALPYGRGED